MELKIKSVVFKKKTNYFTGVLTDGIVDILNIKSNENIFDYTVLDEHAYRLYNISEEVLLEMINKSKFNDFLKKMQRNSIVVGFDNDINFKTYKIKYDHSIVDLGEYENNMELKIILENYIKNVITYKIRNGEKILNTNLQFVDINI